MKSGIGICLLTAPYLLTIFSDLGVKDLAVRIALNLVVIVLFPTAVLFVATLVRSPKIRKRDEEALQSQLQTVSDGIKALKEQEQTDEKEILRLQNVVTNDIDARLVKDQLETDRWGLLNERLRVQEEADQIATDQTEERVIARQILESEERLGAAREVKLLKDELDDARKEDANTRELAQEAKDRIEDDRWDLLNERLRVQKEADQIATDQTEERVIARQVLESEERLGAAREVKLLKDELDDARKEDANTRELAQEAKDRIEDDRWNLLNERLRVKAAADQVNLESKAERVLARQELESEERLVAAREVKLLKDELEDARREDASSREQAQEVKDKIEDKRWAILTESLRQHKVDSGQELEDQREEREILRERLAKGLIRADNKKNSIDSERWESLHERMNIQEARNDARDLAQLARDVETDRLRNEDRVRDLYRTLLNRYIRHAAAQGLPPTVADGLAPIPKEWIREQPEILRTPALEAELDAFMR